MTIYRNALAVVLLVMVASTACQERAASGPDPGQPVPLATQAGLTIRQADDIFGIWTLTSHPYYKLAYWLLRPDGTFTFSPNQDGGRPSESGKYRFEEGMFLIKDDFCPTPGKYRVIKGDTAEGPSLVIEDGCTARVKILTTAPA